MNHIGLDNNSPNASTLGDWMLARGIRSATTQEVAQFLNVPRDQVRQRMLRPRRQGSIISPARGLWVPVPLEYRLWGAPEPLVYIDSMMSHLGVEYCIGWLSAAAFYGAEHQAVQVFQVATSRQLQSKTIGRSRLDFVHLPRIALLPKQRIVRGIGVAMVATLEATMLMLSANLDLAGGIDNAATTIIELADNLEEGYEDKILQLAPVFSGAAIRRLGWILDHFGDKPIDKRWRDYSASVLQSKSFLDSQAPREGRYDSVWHLVINAEVDPDI